MQPTHALLNKTPAPPAQSLPVLPLLRRPLIRLGSSRPMNLSDDSIDSVDAEAPTISLTKRPGHCHLETLRISMICLSRETVGNLR